jgi:hypothetical protein
MSSSYNTTNIPPVNANANPIQFMVVIVSLKKKTDQAKLTIDNSAN